MNDKFTGAEFSRRSIRFIKDGHVVLETGGDDLNSWLCRWRALAQVAAMYGVEYDLPDHYLGSDGMLLGSGTVT